MTACADARAMSSGEARGNADSCRNSIDEGGCAAHGDHDRRNRADRRGCRRHPRSMRLADRARAVAQPGSRAPATGLAWMDDGIGSRSRTRGRTPSPSRTRTHHRPDENRHDSGRTSAAVSRSCSSCCSASCCSCARTRRSSSTANGWMTSPRAAIPFLDLGVGGDGVGRRRMVRRLRRARVSPSPCSSSRAGSGRPPTSPSRRRPVPWSCRCSRTSSGRPRPEEILIPSRLRLVPLGPRRQRGHDGGRARPAPVPLVGVGRGRGSGSSVMALSRTYIGAHWVSDTVGGVILGAAVALLLWAPIATRPARGAREAARRSRPALSSPEVSAR